MSINFATLKGLTIPEGNVTQIADASGAVLWKSAPAEAIIKFKVANGGNFSSITTSTYCSLEIDGGYHNATEEIVVPIGKVVTCRFGTTSNQTRKLYLNGAEISSYTYDSTNGTYYYDYTVIGDVGIAMGSSMSMSGGPSGPVQYVTTTITITEL